MCNTFEEYLQKVEKEVAEKAKKEAAKNALMEVAATILASGVLSEEQIAQFTKLSIEEVRELAASMSAPAQ